MGSERTAWTGQVPEKQVGIRKPISSRQIHKAAVYKERDLLNNFRDTWQVSYLALDELRYHAVVETGLFNKMCGYNLNLNHWDYLIRPMSRTRDHVIQIDHTAIIEHELKMTQLITA